MPSTPGHTSRERLLSAAQEMLRESGMAGTGIKDVVARSGAPIGSLYHFFPNGKAQLVTEAVHLQGEKLRQALDRAFETKRSAASSVRAFFDAVADELDASRANAGCAVGAVALDLAPTDAEIRAECWEAFEAWTATIAPHLPFRDERSRRSFATMIVLAIEGAFVLSRTARNGDAFRHAGVWLSATLSTADHAGASRRRAPVPRTRGA